MWLLTQSGPRHHRIAFRKAAVLDLGDTSTRQRRSILAQRDALPSQRRRVPRMLVETGYLSGGAAGRASVLALLAGRRRVSVYRALFEPGGCGWLDHARRGCSMVPGQVAHVAHLNARDTSLA